MRLIKKMRTTVLFLGFGVVLVVSMAVQAHPLDSDVKEGNEDLQAFAEEGEEQEAETKAPEEQNGATTEKSLGKKIRERVKEKVGKIKEKAKGLFEKAKEKAKEVANKIKED